MFRSQYHRRTTAEAGPQRAEAPRKKRMIGGRDTASEREADGIAAAVGAAAPRTGLASRIGTMSGDASGGFAPPLVDTVLDEPGAALDAATRGAMERRFGHDFSGVRVHVDADAARSARAIGAVAYAAGRHIVFDHGRFRPGDAAGRRLIAHELAHVVQQSRMPAGTAAPIQRRVEMRDVGRGEHSGIARLPELIERLNAISTGLVFAMDGRNLTCERREGTGLSHFDQRMLAFIEDEARVVPLRLTNRHGLLGSHAGGFHHRVEVDAWHSGYVDIDDLLASSDLGLQSALLHFLRERHETRNYARRIGSQSLNESLPGPAREFDRVHGRGIDEEVQLLRAFFADPSIRYLDDGAGQVFRHYRNDRGDTIRMRVTPGRGRERRGIDAVSIEVRTRDHRILTADEYREESLRSRAGSP